MSRIDGKVVDCAVRGAEQASAGGGEDGSAAGVAGKRAGFAASAAPDPEVLPQARRRRFTAAYKARVVEESERCTEPGAVGALLRREGLYSSHLSKWREQYRRGGLAALRDEKRGRPAVRNPLEDEVARLRGENERLRQRLAQAETIVEIQKKVSSMLTAPPGSAVNGERP